MINVMGSVGLNPGHQRIYSTGVYLQYELVVAMTST